MNCPSCGSAITDSPNFCPSCGKRLNKEVSKSDFEIGKIAALDTIKSDVLSWLFKIAAVGTLVGILSVHEYVKQAVNSSVNTQLSGLSTKIDKASSDAEEATVRAQLETKQLDKTIDGLGGKANSLSSSIDALDTQKGRLVTSVKQLQAQKQKMVSATSDLEEKRKELSKIIEAENLTTLFVKDAL